MKSRRYRLRYSAPDNSARWKCNWLECASGMGLAGMGLCASTGEWWNKDCPKFQTIEQLEKEMKEAHADERTA